jgi:hypothetical protein
MFYSTRIILFLSVIYCLLRSNEMSLSTTEASKNSLSLSLIYQGGRQAGSTTSHDIHPRLGLPFGRLYGRLNAPHLSHASPQTLCVVIIIQKYMCLHPSLVCCNMLQHVTVSKMFGLYRSHIVLQMAGFKRLAL